MTTELAATNDSETPIGLEDFGAADEQIPRLRIVQAEGVFEDNLTKEKFSELQGVCLGLVRQRVLFHEDPDEFDGPMCRSSNFAEGRPWRKNFPWELSGFEEADFDVDDRLPCEKCRLKEWGTHPGRDTPYCSEQFTLPWMREHEDGSSRITLVTFQKSSVKAVKGFLSAFKQEGTPAFVKYATVRLQMARRGNVDYSVAEFVHGDPTDPDDHTAYGETFVNIRTYLHSAGGGGKTQELPVGAAPASTTSKAPDTDEDPF